jgi:hypothetical protein
MSFGTVGVRGRLHFKGRQMSISEIPAGAEKDLEEDEGGSRACGPASADEALIVDLARRLAPAPWSPHAEAVSESGRTYLEPMQPIEAATPRPTIVFPPAEASGTAALDVAAPHASMFGVPYSRRPHDAGWAAGRRSGGWILKASALAAAGAALTVAALAIAVFGPEGGSPGAPKAPTLIAGQSPTEASEPSGETIAPKGDVDAARLKAVTPVKIVTSVERPTAPGADAAPVASPPPAAEPQPTAETSAGPPAAAPQPSDSNLARSASAPLITTAAPSANASEAARHNAPGQSANPAARAGSKVVAVAESTMPKHGLPANLSKRTSARLTIAKTASTAPGAAAGMQSQPLLPAASLTPAEPPAVNPVTHAFGPLAAALGAPSVDQAASSSGNWAIQFAAPKSEAEAEVAAARLNAKYAQKLGGATIGVHKTTVNSETIYALRVAGLSKADAAALCERVKGRDCALPKETGDGARDPLSQPDRTNPPGTAR